MSFITALKIYYAFTLGFNPVYSEAYLDYFKSDYYSFRADKSFLFKAEFKIVSPKRFLFLGGDITNYSSHDSGVKFTPLFDEYKAYIGFNYKIISVGLEIFCKHPVASIGEHNMELTPSYSGRQTLFIRIGNF